MSLSWRDRLHVVLTPRRVILVRFGKGLGTRVVAKDIVPCPATAGDGGPVWQPALETLLGALADRRWKRAPARVILSNHFVHYQLVPWQEKVASEEEQLALIRYRFTETYGEAAGDWFFIWDEGRPPAPILACGLDRGLLAGLRDAFQAAGLPLQSIQPYLATAFNRWRRQLDGQKDWFLLAEPERICLAWFRDEDWDGLHSQQVGPDWGGELPQILERVFLLSGRERPPERLCIAAPETPEGAMALADGWSGSQLRLPACPGFVPGEDAPFAMAMSL